MSRQAVKSTIDANIRQNGTQAITGPVLNYVLNTMADDYAEQAKLAEVEEKIYLESEINISEYPRRDYFIKTDNLWNTTSYWKHRIIPCSAGDAFRIVANDEHIARYAWLTDDAVVVDAMPYYCAGTTAVTLSAGESSGLIFAPQDAHFLYIASSNNDAGDIYDPQVLYEEEEMKQKVKPLVNMTSRSNYDVSRWQTYSVLGGVGDYARLGTTSTYRHMSVKIPKGAKSVTCSFYGRTAVSQYVRQLDKDNRVLAVSEASVSTNNELITLSNIVLLPNATQIVISTYASLGVDLNELDCTFNIDLVAYAEQRNETIKYSVSQFANIGVIGASWDSGYFSTNGTNRIENNSYSWMANLARRNGVNAGIFARRSTWTRRWLNEDAAYGLDKMLAADPCGLYVIDLCGNDSEQGESYLGTIADINDTDYHLNADTFYGNYARIISIILEKSPNAKIVCASFYMLGNSTTKMHYVTAIDEIAAKFGLPRIHWENDEWYADNLYPSSSLLGSHPNVMQLTGVSYSFERLLSRCIDENMDYFQSYYIG